MSRPSAWRASSACRLAAVSGIVTLALLSSSRNNFGTGSRYDRSITHKKATGRELDGLARHRVLLLAHIEYAVRIDGRAVSVTTLAGKNIRTDGKDTRDVEKAWEQ